MDWFERITGFRETDHATTQAQLQVDGDWLVCRATGARHRMGRLELVELRTLRARRAATAAAPTARGRSRVRGLVGDVRALHAQPAFAGATFQVASQFNLLEMVGPEVTPESGVTRYAHDATQGPACAMAAGAGTIYRNYLVPVNGRPGQTAQRQIDALAPLGEGLAQRLGRPPASLWTMRNGYALCHAKGLQAIGDWLRQADEAERDRLRGLLAVGVHREVDVTDVAHPRPQVTQVYASALPVAYSGIAAPAWAPLARLVLEAAYEATVLAAVEQARAGGSPTVLLTRLGGGAFGNDDAWIDAAIERALGLVADEGLDLRLVSHGALHPGFARIERVWPRV